MTLVQYGVLGSSGCNNCALGKHATGKLCLVRIVALRAKKVCMLNYRFVHCTTFYMLCTSVHTAESEIALAMFPHKANISLVSSVYFPCLHPTASSLNYF